MRVLFFMESLLHACFFFPGLPKDLGLWSVKGLTLADEATGCENVV